MERKWKLMRLPSISLVRLLWSKNNGLGLLVTIGLFFREDHDQEQPEIRRRLIMLTLWFISLLFEWKSRKSNSRFHALFLRFFKAFIKTKFEFIFNTDNPFKNGIFWGHGEWSNCNSPWDQIQKIMSKKGNRWRRVRMWENLIGTHNLTWQKEIDRVIIEAIQKWKMNFLLYLMCLKIILVPSA